MPLDKPAWPNKVKKKHPACLHWLDCKNGMSYSCVLSDSGLAGNQPVLVISVYNAAPSGRVWKISMVRFSHWMFSFYYCKKFSAMWMPILLPAILMYCAENSPTAKFNTNSAKAMAQACFWTYTDTHRHTWNVHAKMRTCLCCLAWAHETVLHCSPPYGPYPQYGKSPRNAILNMDTHPQHPL